MSSKYDVIKLKVRVRDEHFYILSRFQLSKMLMFCKVPEGAAIKVALDVKRFFVAQERIEITQAELERVLASIMAACGFGERHSQLMPVITAFYSERVPLVILISGDPLSGKTTLAQLLGARLNCNAIVNAEVIYDLMGVLSPAPASPSSPDADSADDAFALWEARCVWVHGAILSEVDKAISEGKVLIVEGVYVNLCLFSQYLGDHCRQLRHCIVLGVHLSGSPHSAQVSQLWGERSGASGGNMTGGPALSDAGCPSNALPDAEREDLADSGIWAGVAGRRLSRLEQTFGSGGPPALAQLTVSDQGVRGGPSQEPLPSATAAVWHMRLSSPTALPAAVDALHGVAVDRILDELLDRGRLTREDHRALKTQ